MATEWLTVGIDYGTTNSCIAYDDGSRVQVIKLGQHHTTPSVVLLKEPGEEPLVGRPAAIEGRDRPEFCFRSVKRLFSRKVRPGEALSWQQAPGPDGYVWLRGPDRDYSPAEIAACSIHDMLDWAQNRLQGKRPNRAVITCPARFDDEQRACLLQAGKIAGLEEVVLLDEPVAAGIAHGLNRGGTIKHYATYDEGGGTFDFTVLIGGRGKLAVKGKGGRTAGGDDVDAMIVEWLKDGYYDLHGVDLGQSGAAVERLRDAAETAKITLSEHLEARIDLALIELIPPRGLQATLTREKLEEMMAPHIAANLAEVEATMAKYNLTIGNIAEWVRVGGMTNVPATVRALEAFAGKTPRTDLDPDEVVAMGAAMMAGVLDNRRKPFHLENTLSRHFGFEASGNAFMKVIGAEESFPADEGMERTVIITSEDDGQDELSVHILEGDGLVASETKRLAAFDIPVLPAPAGEASVELTFAVDANGMKSVRYPGGVIYDGAAGV